MVVHAILPNSFSTRLPVQSPELKSHFFFLPLCGLTLNIEFDWSVVMFTATGCPCGHNNQPITFKMGLIWVLQPQFTTLLSSIHSVAPIIILTLTKILNDLENTFSYLDNFFYKSGMIHMKSSTAHNI